MKLFVWDFHGVLEKGNGDAVVEITNRALEHHGYSRRMTEAENDFLSGLRWNEYFSFLLPGLDPQIYFELQASCFHIAQSQPEVTFKYIRLNDHAREVLTHIKNSEHCQILISNTPSKPLEMYVKNVQIEDYFPLSHRFGVDTQDPKGLTKQDYLNQFLEQNGPFDAVVSIGDSAGDMALIHGNEIGIGYLYSHPEKPHRNVKSHYKITDLREVLNEFKENEVYLKSH